MNIKPKLRIYAYSRLQRDYGYDGLHRHYYQDLQARVPWGWMTIDTEEVPTWAKCYDAIGGCDWKSKFASIGSWGRDGLVTRHAA